MRRKFFSFFLQWILLVLLNTLDPTNVLYTHMLLVSIWKKIYAYHVHEYRNNITTETYIFPHLLFRY